MRALLFLLLLTGCAETRVYEHGKLLAVVQGDAWNVNIKTPYTDFHADVINHSESTKVYGSMAVGAAGAIGTAAVLGGL